MSAQKESNHCQCMSPSFWVPTWTLCCFSSSVVLYATKQYSHSGSSQR